ncbi:MAG TPA: META domain-containing protein [Bryobacteraceae bacterium]|nr:META domain-containing protein [Bryobacteraceae bacterium]
MRTIRILALFCICFTLISAEQKRTVTGKLTRVMAIGGESTGWAIQLESEINLDGKPVHSIEANSTEIKKFEALENKRVRATGTISHRHGVERGDRSILDVSSIREVKSTAAFTLTGSEWLLEDLAGAGVIDNVQATLAFPEAAKVSGKGSCNRFFGPAEVAGNTIKLGPLGATRMACPEAIMNQETKYLKALQAADRFEWKDPYLLLHSKGVEKPLRFTRLASPQK